VLDTKPVERLESFREKVKQRFLYDASIAILTFLFFPPEVRTATSRSAHSTSSKRHISTLPTTMTEQVSSQPFPSSSSDDGLPVHDKSRHLPGPIVRIPRTY